MNGLSHLRRHTSVWGGGASLAFVAHCVCCNRCVSKIERLRRFTSRHGSATARSGALVTESSEPDGYFRSDNLVSNELTFQHVIPELLDVLQPGGVYLGVGPDQNFTYIAALRPRIAFIVDIRRGAMLQHLMYKAIIELSRDRADFLATLFSRPRPAGLDSSTTVNDLLDAFDAVPPDSAMFARNLRLIKRASDDHASF